MSIQDLLETEVDNISFEDVEFLKTYGDVRLGCGSSCGGDNGPQPTNN
ncbi:MAG: hypothetical protein ABF683_11670 [Sporolactobacillus sp.]